jgi:hypothetical protein
MTQEVFDSSEYTLKELKINLNLMPILIPMSTLISFYESTAKRSGNKFK